jgi:hypothetical protein
VELRRALLLFAIVLGLAAIASSIARQPDDDAGTTADTTTAPEPAQPPAPAPRADDPGATGVATPPTQSEELTIRFSERGAPQARRLEAGRAATVLVEVEASGQVYVPSLGLTAAAEPLTPARFDVLLDEPGTHPLELDPAEPSRATVRLGTLTVSAS